MELKKKFMTLWEKYFGEAELPIVFFYTDDPGDVEAAAAPAGHRCLIGDLHKVRKGRSLCFDAAAIGCFGGKRYLGFTSEIMPNFEYFLSCGIPDKLEGERYKKSPELVREMMNRSPQLKAPARYAVFKRWDMLEQYDKPEVVIFFAPPDVMSGLFTLANFDEVEPNGVFTPFCAGCGAIALYPYLEKDAERPRCVLGMFDVSARPFVAEHELTFAAPMNKFATMVDNMEESFLVTSSWNKVKKRIGRIS
jgi:uncharacterized protein (DUF169 family)